MNRLKELYVQMNREYDAQRIDDEIHSIDAQGEWLQENQNESLRG